MTIIMIHTLCAVTSYEYFECARLVKYSIHGAADRVHWRFRSAPFCATARSRFVHYNVGLSCMDL